MAKSKVIKPELLGGFRDMLPDEAIIFESIVRKVKNVYESFGFVPLDTPCMERLEVLVGDTADFDKTIFTAKVVRGLEDRNVEASDLGGDDSALRFDLTVPLARIVSAYPEIPKPFKRYQLGKVFRGEKPQAGRYREFYQLDFDTIGSPLVSADFEVVLIMYSVMKALDIDNFLIKFNSRKILNGLADVVGRSERADEVFRIIDKMDKIGLGGVLKELKREPDNQFDESALSLSDEEAKKVEEFLSIKGDTPEDRIHLLREFFGDKTEIGLDGVKEMEYICQNLAKFDIPSKNWSFDLSIARGLGYYNGPVFETLLTDLPQLGSVFSGGRYDGLTDRFIANSNISGVGASVGIDRLIVGMKQLGLIEKQVNQVEVVVSVFNEDLRDDSTEFAYNLRAEGINTEMFLGTDLSLKNQFAYALKKNAAYLVIIGPDEKEKGVVQVKNLAERKQETVTFDECVAFIKGK